MNNSIGNKLVTLRKTKGITQEEFSRLTGISRSTIGNYEINRRTPSLKELEKIAKFYGVGLEFFGVAKKDEIKDLLTRAKSVFDNSSIPMKEKENLYVELMKLYINLTDKKGK